MINFFLKNHFSTLQRRINDIHDRGWRMVQFILNFTRREATYSIHNGYKGLNFTCLIFPQNFFHTFLLIVTVIKSILSNYYKSYKSPNACKIEKTIA